MRGHDELVDTRSSNRRKQERRSSRYESLRGSRRRSERRDAIARNTARGTATCQKRYRVRSRSRLSRAIFEARVSRTDARCDLHDLETDVMNEILYGSKLTNSEGLLDANHDSYAEFERHVQNVLDAYSKKSSKALGAARDTSIEPSKSIHAHARIYIYIYIYTHTRVRILRSSYDNRYDTGVPSRAVVESLRV